MEVSVKSVVLVRVAAGGEMSKEDFRVETSALRVELKEGELLLRVLVMSADPYLRSRFKMGELEKAALFFVPLWKSSCVVIALRLSPSHCR